MRLAKFILIILIGAVASVLALEMRELAPSFLLKCLCGGLGFSIPAYCGIRACRMFRNGDKTRARTDQS